MVLMGGKNVLFNNLDAYNNIQYSERNTDYVFEMFTSAGDSNGFRFLDYSGDSSSLAPSECTLPINGRMSAVVSEYNRDTNLPTYYGTNKGSIYRVNLQSTGCTTLQTDVINIGLEILSIRDDISSTNPVLYVSLYSSDMLSLLVKIELNGGSFQITDVRIINYKLTMIEIDADRNLLVLVGIRDDITYYFNFFLLQ